MEEEEAESALSAVLAAASDEVLSHAVAAAAEKKVSRNNLVYLKGKAVINGARPILVYWPLFVFLPTQKRGNCMSEHIVAQCPAFSGQQLHWAQ